MGAHEANMRVLVHGWLGQHYPGARILDEVGLAHGDVRADVVALTTETFHAIELKSHADTLRRLPLQVQVYGQVADMCTLVVAARLCSEAWGLLPAWWGVVISHHGHGLESVRRAERNPSPSPYTTASLLWRPEAMALLKEPGAARGHSRSHHRKLCAALAAALPEPALRAHVRAQLLRRDGWHATSVGHVR